MYGYCKSPENCVCHILHECLDPDRSMNALLSNTKRLQHHLLDKVMKAQVNIFLDKNLERIPHDYVSCKEKVQAHG